MLSAKAVKRWYWWHKWTSLICTLFLLLLCVTGLPLIFHHELEHALSDLSKPTELADGAPDADFDRVIAAAHQARPNDAVQLVFQEPGEERTVIVAMNAAVEAPLAEAQLVTIDTRSAEVLGQQALDEGVLAFIHTLHVDLFMGLPGKLFLGLMALLFLIAVISGVLIYAPFMRERSFVAVRRDRGLRSQWLDLHNGLGIVVALWVTVVGMTGLINTWADLVIKYWQFTEMASMIAANAPDPNRPFDRAGQKASLQQAVDSALAAANADVQSGRAGAGESWQFYFVAFPGSEFSSDRHYAIFLRGSTPLTSRLLKPVLIEADSGRFTATRPMPWYVTTLLVSQPLHFGDYGGLPLKILWALLDLITIVVLLSGLYLWWQKRKAEPELEYRKPGVVGQAA